MHSAIRTSGFITVPPRESLFGSVVILLLVGVMSAAFVVPGAFGLYTLGVVSFFLLLAIVKRYVSALHLSVLAFLLFLPLQFGTSVRLWPLNALVPLVIYALIAGIVPALRRSTNWLKRGSMDPNVIRLVIATAIISAVALIGWVIVMKPDIERHVARIPGLPLWVYPFAGVGFAVVNAVMEEAIFRGVIMEALDSALGTGHWSVGIQAVPFAALHYVAGFPHGLSGFMMVLVYGVMLGAVRRVSKGMLAPVLAHIVADVTIFSILTFIFFQVSK
jgi:hypothetical protein